jgi:PilZ domain
VQETTTANQHETSAEGPKIEQRRHRRLPVSLDVQTSWIDGFGAENCAPAVVKDISAGGFCIEAVYRRPVGSRLTVETQRHLMQCVVRHVQSRQGLFYLGLEIVPLLVVEAATGQSLDRLGSALSQEG